MALTDKKLPTNAEVDDMLAVEIRSRLDDETLTCSAAFALSESHGLAPSAVGQAADGLRIHLSRCQLGLFGYPGHAKGWQVSKAAERPVPPGLEDAVREACGKSGELTCVAAWAVAERFSAPRIQVGYIADKLGIKVGTCQLGAF